MSWHVERVEYDGDRERVQYLLADFLFAAIFCFFEPRTIGWPARAPFS
jgi:hypothetical protein